MIASIQKAYTRLYRDNGQLTAYVEWTDTRGRQGRTEGPAIQPKRPAGVLMAALFARAMGEGVTLQHEVW